MASDRDLQIAWSRLPSISTKWVCYARYWSDLTSLIELGAGAGSRPIFSSFFESPRIVSNRLAVIRLRSACEERRVSHKQADAGHNTDIGKIEGGPVITRQVKIQEICCCAVIEAIHDIAESASDNQPKGPHG